MTKPRLQYRLPTLDNIPAFLRDAYEPDPSGGFRLAVDGVSAAAPPAAPAAGGQRKRAEQLRDQMVERLVARIAPRAETRDAVADALRALIRNDGTEEEPSFKFLESKNGWPLPSGAAGRDFADEDEFLAHALTKVVKPEQLPAAPPPPKTREQAARDDSEAWQPKPKNIRIPSGCSQREFEDAFAEAKRRGGEVILDDAAPPAPTRKYDPARDVPLTSNSSQEQFESALRLARSRGGEVVYVDGDGEPAKEAG